MNKGIVGAIAFVLGGAIGSLVTWKVIEKKYEEKAQEEIDSVKEAYSRKMASKNRELKKVYIPEEPSEPEKSKTKPLSSIVNDYAPSNDRPDYSAYSSAKQEGVPENKPYVITAEEFGEFEDYEKIELSYYELSNVLTDDMDEPVENPDRVVGLESLEHFGDYTDAVYVRNDRLKCDYEILRVAGEYMEGV